MALPFALIARQLEQARSYQVKLDADAERIRASFSVLDDLRTPPDVVRFVCELQLSLQNHFFAEEQLVLPVIAAFSNTDARAITDDHARVRQRLNLVRIYPGRAALLALRDDVLRHERRDALLFDRHLRAPGL